MAASSCEGNGCIRKEISDVRIRNPARAWASRSGILSTPMSKTFNAGFAARTCRDEAFPARQGLEARGIFTVRVSGREARRAGALPLHARSWSSITDDDPEQPGRTGVPAAASAPRSARRSASGSCAAPTPQTGRPVPEPEAVLHRHRHLHELRLLRRVLPVRRDQDGSRLRAGQLRPHLDAHFRQAAALEGVPLLAADRAHHGLRKKRSRAVGGNTRT